MLSDSPDFYPTRPATIEKMLAGLKLSEIDEVLDLGAGRGDIAEYIQKKREDDYYNRRYVKADVIEIDPNLQHVLRDKGFRLVHDDILTFDSEKHYDLIVGNLPFSIGAECLQRALSILEATGGHLRVLVNAETLRNPCERVRIAVKARLERLGAEVEYLADEFKSAERQTDVEVALVKLYVEPPEAPSILLDDLRRAAPVMEEESQAQALVGTDFTEALVASFGVECRTGIRLIDEYFALRPYIRDAFRKADEERDYSKPLIKLEVEGSRYSEGKASYVNAYLEGVREKYWALLLSNRSFRAKFTSNILSEMDSKLKELRHYDFTPFNIAALIEEMNSKIVAGIEAAILELFDKCSGKFSYHSDVNNGNVWYYNGWKTNKAHKINKRIVLPMNGLSAWHSGTKLEYHIHKELADMVKVFNYLSDEPSEDVPRLVGNACHWAEQRENFNGIDLRFFDITFYKKGTAHIKFKDLRLLDKLNIFGSQRKGWLPPAYGRKRYEEMGQEEREVVDSFQGRAAYEEVLKRPDFWLVNPAMLLGEGSTAPPAGALPEAGSDAQPTLFGG